MLKRKTSRRTASFAQAVESVEPRIVLSAIQPIAVADSDAASLKEKTSTDSQDKKLDVQSKTTTVADVVTNKNMTESAGKQEPSSTAVDSKFDIKVADHLHQMDSAAIEMISAKGLGGNLKGGLSPDAKLSPGDLGGRDGLSQDSDEMTFTEDEVDAFERLHEAEMAAVDGEFEAAAQDESLPVPSDTDQALEEIERVAMDAEEAAGDLVKIPTPDEAGGGTTGSGDHDPDREDITPGVGDPREDEERDGPVAQVGDVSAGNTNWGEGHTTSPVQDKVLDTAAQRVIDIYFETLGGKINPLPMK